MSQALWVAFGVAVGAGAGWWLTREWKDAPLLETVVDECCENGCGEPLTESTIHVVYEVSGDDVELGVSAVGGATAMSASFCAVHCPGGGRELPHCNRYPHPSTPNPGRSSERGPIGYHPPRR